MAECDKVCNYIDLPLQHASNAGAQADEAARARGRPTTRCSTASATRVPGVALRTTFIVGFPGETDADVDELCGFVADHAFDHVGVFTYSHEEGTSAYALDDDVPARPRRRAATRVMSLQKRLVQRRQRARIGERVRVLVDGPSAEHELVLQGAAGDAGARHRRVGVPHRVRPVERIRAGRFCRGRDRRRPRTTISIARPRPVL